MPRYCKAYLLGRLREFHGWAENTGGAALGEGKLRTDLDDDLDVVYLQADFSVTEGIYADERVIFANVSPDWVEFCKTCLEFEIPEYAGDRR